MTTDHGWQNGGGGEPDDQRPLPLYPWDPAYDQSANQRNGRHNSPNNGQSNGQGDGHVFGGGQPRACSLSAQSAHTRRRGSPPSAVESASRW